MTIEPGWEMQMDNENQRWDEEQAELTKDYEAWLQTLPPWWQALDNDTKWIEEYEKCLQDK
jgi:hypothetical protein